MMARTPARIAVVLGALLGSALGSDAMAQKPLKAGLLGSPRVGKQAAEIVVPYHAAAGPGPADQPFRLTAELGRVVVLIFGGRPDTSSARGWREQLVHADSLRGRSVVIVGVVRGGSDLTQPLATELGGDVKLLADADGKAHRTYGIGDGSRYWSAFVVADNGLLVWSGRVSSSSPGDWKQIGDAVRRGQTALPPPG